MKVLYVSLIIVVTRDNISLYFTSSYLYKLDSFL